MSTPDPPEPHSPTSERHRDEMVDGDGVVRAGWGPLQEHLEREGAPGLRAEQTRIQRRLHSHGATFEVAGEPSRGWPLDPVPLVVDRAEWAALGRALEQRARVLEAVLADVFGEQRLLRSGELPTDAIVVHRDLLRPCIGVVPGGARHLVLHAVDVARRADGAFTVLADRTQAPSGAGYTLENREVLSSTSGELVRRSGVEPLRPWFSVLRRTLAELAPPGVDDPRVVILTPGPLSETYFEHGLLSRTLGYTLVEPADLTVRDGHVFLKSVTGLEPVHVIWRRVDAEWCDSLELRTDSLLGVPGLVEAARRRNVSVVNPLGSGLAENPALAPYLPRLTRLLLGEDPLVEQAPSWWCGDPSSRSHVLSRLDELVLEPIDRGRAQRSTFGRTCNRDQLDDLAARIRAEPHRWVGQEEQPLSTAPSFDGTSIVRRHVVMRAFVVAHDDGYAWMDGALTRSSDRPEAVTMSRGAWSKDTWIVAPPSERSWSAGRTISLPQVDLRDSVTSSTASSLYWMGRNHERADVVIRVVGAVDEELRLWPDLREEADGDWVHRVTAAVAALTLEDAAVAQRPSTSLDAVLVGALVDPTHPRGVPTSLHFLLTGARSVRERLSADAARMLGDLELLQPRLADAAPIEARELAEAIVAPLSALAGLMGGSMVRDAGWRFLDLGRRIERSELLCRLLAATITTSEPETVAAPLRETVLAGWDCLGAYRRRHRSDVETSTMLSLLLYDPGNPRSLRFQLARACEDVAALPDRPPIERAMDTPATILERIVATVDAHTPAGLARTGADGRRDTLADVLRAVSAGLAALEERVELDYVAHVGPGTLLGEEPRSR